MNIAIIQTVWTLVIAALFVAVVIWAFGRKRKKFFEDAANIPLEEDGDDIHG